MPTKRLISQYGIYNGKPCEFVLQPPDNTWTGSGRQPSTQRYEVRYLTADEIAAKVSDHA